MAEEHPEHTKRFTCPCQFPEIEPCRKNCACGRPYMSGVCLRCCRFGSYEQQLIAAMRIARVMDQANTDTDTDELRRAYDPRYMDGNNG